MIDTLWIARVYSRSLTRPTCDPALALDADDAGERITEYSRSRTEEALLKLPVREGAQLSQWGVRRLSRGALKYVAEASTQPDRMQRAVQCGLVGSRPAGLPEVAYRRTKVGGLSDVLSDADLDRVYKAIGQAGLDELGSVILALSEAGEDDLAPFGPPPGQMLPR